MADKPRTPDPPRKVQAPKVRQKHPTKGGGFAMPTTNVLIGAGLVGLVAVVLVLILALSGTSSGSAGNVTAGDVTRVRTAMTAAGCTFEGKRSSAEQQHMSDPPISGHVSDVSRLERHPQPDDVDLGQLQGAC